MLVLEIQAYTAKAFISNVGSRTENFKVLNWFFFLLLINLCKKLDNMTPWLVNVGHNNNTKKTRDKTKQTQA